MGVYIITDGEGSYIHRDEATGKYVPIRSFKKATQWDAIKKANSVLNNSVTKAIRSGYAVQLIDTEQTVEKEDITMLQKLCFKKVEDDNIKDWFEKINLIREALSGLDARQTELKEKLSRISKEIVDIRHYIEFGKFNAYQGWMCFKILQNLLKQRRKIKNEQQVLGLIKQNQINGDSMAALAQTISDIQNKCYTPRALPELFISGK